MKASKYYAGIEQHYHHKEKHRNSMNASKYYAGNEQQQNNWTDNITELRFELRFN
jgi:hypothetical protein